MTDLRAFLDTAHRLRAEAESAPDAPLDLERLLPRLYPVACVEILALSVSRLRDWLERREVAVPLGLTTCHDRRLRGGIVAWRGHGLLFADRNDSADEIRFTFAHEAAHFLHDHLYPREDLLQRFGPSILPVLDGQRPPTLTERVDAILSRRSLALQTHLLDREAAPDPIDTIETLADAFACEILAPRAALDRHFPRLPADDKSISAVCALLADNYHLPPVPALRHARAFVGDYGQTISLLDRLGLT